MRLWPFLVCIHLSCIFRAQDTPERTFVDSIIKLHCRVCHNEGRASHSGFAQLFHQSHDQPQYKNDGRRLLSIMQATELAQQEKDLRSLFFCIC